MEPTHATEPLDKAKRFLILGINKAAALIDQAETYLSTKIARPQLIQVGRQTHCKALTISGRPELSYIRMCRWHPMPLS